MSVNVPGLSGMILLPCKEGVCQECAVDHPADVPHNCGSLYYQYKFYAEQGRWPTWKDAIAHCDDITRKLWEAELRRRGGWNDI